MMKYILIGIVIFILLFLYCCLKLSSKSDNNF